MWQALEQFAWRAKLNAVLKREVVRAFEGLNAVGRATPMGPPSGVSGVQLAERNERHVVALLQQAGAAILYRERGTFAPILYAERVSTSRCTCLLGRALERGLMARVRLRRGGRAVDLSIASSAALRALRVGASHVAVEAMTFHERIAGGDAVTGLHFFGTTVRLVERRNGWWVNPWSDVDSTPVAQTHLRSLSMPTSQDADAPIDVVYTWVDGDDPMWRQRKEEALTFHCTATPQRASNRSRWENRDELRYSLRSVKLYAPWVRHVYLVTDAQVPEWLNPDSDGLTIVDHRSLFPDIADLPTFNSHAIESVLHRIPGLSDQFLYLNDDVFFTRPACPADFFTAAGHAKIFLSRSRMPVGDSHGRERASEWGGMNASRLLESSLGVRVGSKLKHAPLAVRRDVMEDVEERFSAALERTRASRFRSPYDVAPLTALYAHYALTTGAAVAADYPYVYVDLGSSRLAALLQTARMSSAARALCLNDTEETPDSLSWDARERLVSQALELMLPWPSVFEAQGKGPYG